MNFVYDTNVNPIFNFLDPKLSPSVICSTAATDDYEIDNLVSGNFTKRNLGFVAFSSTKPPVEIQFKFICPINIHYLVIKSTVGSQRSSGIQIMGKNDKMEYTHLSKAIFKQPGIFFCNSKIYSKDQGPRSYDKNLYHLAFFNSASFRVYSEATSIKVIIFKTERTVPCLAAVEVYGAPSQSCSKITRETVTRIMTKKHPQIEMKKDIFCIPDDFKDNLTYELMTVPFTLPSGNTIDQRTLEKHTETEAEFGRKPSDPFTGIKFTEKLKPILNVALKSRIDMFILQNNDRLNFINHKRILGRVNLSENKNSKNKKIKMAEVDDLDEAIAKIKKSPGFINISDSNENDNGKKLCLQCKKSQNFLYKINCEHLYCRQCLQVILNHFTCSQCNRTFCTKDIQKINI